MIFGAANRANQSPFNRDYGGINIYTIHEGDCLRVMKTLPDNSIDAIITDPPYSSGSRREAGRTMRKSMTRSATPEEWFGTDSLSTNGFQWLMRECAMEWYRLLKPGGHAIIFIDWRMMLSLSSAIESADLRHIGVLVWDKDRIGMGAYFRNQHELMLHFTKGVSNPPLRKDVPNVLTHKPVTKKSHPTEKPVELLERLVSVICPVGGTVLDSFAGSGSTLVACAKTGRNAIGIERERSYCEIIRDRMQEIQEAV